MNLKKLGLPVLCCGAAFLTSCGYTYNYNKTLTYEEAKTWVKNNYGETGSVETLPKTLQSEWYFGGYIISWSLSYSNTLQYLSNHMSSFLCKNAFITGEQAASTGKNKFLDPSCEYTEDEYSFSTYNLEDKPYFEVAGEDIKKQLGAEKYYSNLTEEIFDDTIDYFFPGILKNTVSFDVDNKEKTLNIHGTYTVITYDAKTGGKNIIKIPCCTVSFNEKGLLTSLSFDFTSDAICSYTWAPTSGKIDAFTFNILKGCYIKFVNKY